MRWLPSGTVEELPSECLETGDPSSHSSVLPIAAGGEGRFT
jgi:hypothetical protein